MVALKLLQQPPSTWVLLSALAAAPTQYPQQLLEGFRKRRLTDKPLAADRMIKAQLHSMQGLTR